MGCDLHGLMIMRVRTMTDQAIRCYKAPMQAIPWGGGGSTGGGSSNPNGKVLALENSTRGRLLSDGVVSDPSVGAFVSAACPWPSADAANP